MLFWVDLIAFCTSESWQKVPKEIRNSSTLDIFKEKIKLWKCNDCPCSPCKNLGYIELSFFFDFFSRCLLIGKLFYIYRLWIKNCTCMYGCVFHVFPHFHICRLVVFIRYSKTLTFPYNMLYLLLVKCLVIIFKYIHTLYILHLRMIFFSWQILRKKC